MIAGTLAAAVLGASAPAAAEPSDAEVTRRLAFISARLERGERSASIWWHAWYSSYLALAVGQGIIAGAVNDRGTRADMAVGAVLSSLGAGALGVFDFPARWAGSSLRALPERTPAERRRKLRRAERLLEKAAESEAFGRSWIAHGACGLVAVGSGFLLGFAYKRGWAALTTVVGSMAVSELQIWTQPTAAIAASRAYRAGSFVTAESKPSAAWWRPSLMPGGVGVIGAF